MILKMTADTSVLLNFINLSYFSVDYSEPSGRHTKGIKRILREETLVLSKVKNKKSLRMVKELTQKIKIRRHCSCLNEELPKFSFLNFCEPER